MKLGTLFLSFLVAGVWSSVACGSSDADNEQPDAGAEPSADSAVLPRHDADVDIDAADDDASSQGDASTDASDRDDGGSSPDADASDEPRDVCAELEIAVAAPAVPCNERDAPSTMTGGELVLGHYELDAVEYCYPDAALVRGAAELFTHEGGTYFRFTLERRADAQSPATLEHDTWTVAPHQSHAWAVSSACGAGTGNIVEYTQTADLLHLQGLYPLSWRRVP